MFPALGITFALLARTTGASEQDHPKYYINNTSGNLKHVTGAAAVKALLKDADHLYSNTRDRVFVKPGGYARAIEDFKSLGLTNTKISRIRGEVIRQGQAGDRTILIGRGDLRFNLPAVVVTKRSPNGPKRRSVYIVYKD